MSSLTAVVYPLAWVHLGRGRLGDLLTADLRVALLTSGYVPADTHEWFADVRAYETVGVGYVAGGQAVTGRTLDYDTTAGKAPLTCYPAVFPAASFTARWAVLYLAGDAPATSPLVSRIDLGADVQPGGDAFTLTFSAALMRIGPGA